MTPGQGNSCMFHALLDQLLFHQDPSFAASHSQLRAKLVQAAYNSVKAGKLTWPEGENVEEWRSLMGQEGTMGDQVVLQAAANLFQRQIVILPVFWSAAHLPSLGITLISPSSKSPSMTSSSRSALFLQYFSESRFLTPHYQSVRPKPGDNHLVESLQRSLEGDGKARKDEEEEEEFITPGLTVVESGDSADELAEEEGGGREARKRQAGINQGMDLSTPFDIFQLIFFRPSRGR